MKPGVVRGERVAKNVVSHAKGFANKSTLEKVGKSMAEHKFGTAMMVASGIGLGVERKMAHRMRGSHGSSGSAGINPRSTGGYA
jgi:hypothetical protein